MQMLWQIECRFQNKCGKKTSSQIGKFGKEINPCAWFFINNKLLSEEKKFALTLWHVFIH